MSEHTTTTPTTPQANGATATGGTRIRGARARAKTDTGPIVVPAAAGDAAEAGPTVAVRPVEGTQVMDVPAGAGPDARPDAGPDAGPNAGTDAGPNATAPVTVRPRVRDLRRGPLTRMGPWAPVAGGLLGLLAGLVAVLLLAPAVDTFEDRLSLVLLVVGLGMLGAAGTLLADEVRMVRQGAREAVVRPAWVEATIPLLSGLTPARLLLVLSAFVLFLAAFVTR